MINESRMFKESRFISKYMNFDKIILFGIFEDGLKEQEILEDNIEIRRISLFNIQKRVVQYLYYYFYIFLYIIFKRPKMINIHTLEFLPLAFFARLLKIKVIYDTHELETQKNNVAGMRKKISIFLEKIFIRFTDKVIVVGEAIADEYKKLYPEMPRPTVVLNCPNFVQIEEKPDKFRERFNLPKSSVIFLYQGEFGLGRNVEKLIESFSKITDPEKVIVFMGFGGLEEEVIEASKKQSNIFFHEAVTPDVLLSYTSSADIGISAIENTSKSYNFCMPNKMFEYIMANIPVIVTNLYEMSNFITKNRSGFILENDSVETIIKLVNSIDHDIINSFKDNIQATKERYNWKEQEKKLEIVYEGLFDD